MTHVVRDYGWIERQHGCDAGDTDCMGPIGEYWTFLGVEAGLLWLHAAIALGVALLAGALAAWAWRRSPRRLARILGATVAAWVLAFLAAVAWIGSPIVY